MTKTIMTGLLAFVASSLLLATAAEAHHSHASLNKDDVRLYTGRVVRYSWTMPHVFLKIEGPDEDGDIVEVLDALPEPSIEELQVPDDADAPAETEASG